MNWVNYTKVKTGDKVYGLNRNGRIFFSKGITIKEINSKYILVRYDFGDIEMVELNTLFWK